MESPPLNPVAGLAFLLTCASLAAAVEPGDDPGARELAREVANKGWILFSAKSPPGDYDLFVSRPDGSGLRDITRTPDLDEFGGRFSPGGQKMLYRRLRKGGAANPGEHDGHGVDPCRCRRGVRRRAGP